MIPNSNPTNTPKLSIALMVKNEERTLEKTLKGCQALQKKAQSSPSGFECEIVVLDSGSLDNTLKIAQKFTDNIKVNADWQGFGLQRQRLVDLCQGDWVLMVDADEFLDEALIESVIGFVKNNPPTLGTSPHQSCQAAQSVRTTVFKGQTLRFGGWSGRVTNLLPRKFIHYDPKQLVHEKPLFSIPHKTHKLKGQIYHHSYSSLEHYHHKSIQYVTAQALEFHRRGRRSSILQAVFKAKWAFLRMYVFKLGFLDGRIGFLMAINTAFHTFNKYGQLWLYNQNQPQSIGNKR